VLALLLPRFGKKDPLITYEKALLGQATGGKFPSVTFLERKKMSTKTSIKRIAAVAALALTLGGFSAVSANAAITAHGLRWGEAVALTHNDIYDGRVHISKSIHGPTKSKTGIRTVPYLTNFDIFPRTPKGIRKSLAQAACTSIRCDIHTLTY
jgi:hypothetical protein